MFIPPYRITLSGGGIKGLAHIGALEAIEARGGLRAVKEYIGISAGALCAFCICAGTSLSELRMIASLLDFSTIRDLEPEVMLTFPDSYGLDTGANLDKLMRAVLRAKGLSPSLTFAELGAANCGPRLRVFATDLNTCEICEFSDTTSPDVEVVTALRASMCIPIYFQPVRHPVTGNYLVDGGVISHSPFKFLTDEERATTLSITFSDEHKPREEIGSLPQYLMQLYYALQFHYNRELVACKLDQVIFLHVGQFSSLNFEAGQEVRQAIMDAGKRSAEEFLARFPERPKPVRRFSVV